MSENTRRHEHKLPIAIALTQPAVRTVLVRAWFDDSPATPDDPAAGTAVYPVLAIRSITFHEYVKRGPRDSEPRVYPTHAELESNGWRYQGVRTEDEFLIHDDYIQTADEMVEISNVSGEVVVCTWPESEDDARLAPVKAQQIEYARQRVQGHSPRPVPEAEAASA